MTTPRGASGRFAWMGPATALLVLGTLALLASAALAYEDAEPAVLRSHQGWYEGDRIEYYDLGEATNRTAPVYRLVDSAGDPVEGQHLIFPDLRPGVLVGAEWSSNYSDFHRMWDVTVPPGYVPDELRSLDELVSAGLDMVETDTVLNTPMVPRGSTLVGTASDLHPLMKGWWRGEEVHYLRFGSTMDTPGMFDAASGLVRDFPAVTVFDPPGQLDVFSSYPGEAAHTPLVRLLLFNPISTVYIADSVRSIEEVDRMADEYGYLIFEEGNLYNRPIVGSREEVPRYGHAEARTYNLREAWWNETSKVLYYDMGPVAPEAAPLYRFVSKAGLELVSQHYVLGAVAPAVLTGNVDPEGYSPLWRVHDVLVEDETSFEPDVIKSLSDIEARGMTVTPTDSFVIAPMVTHNATFMPGRMDAPGGGLVRAWYDGAGVYLVLLANETETARVLDEDTLELSTVDLIVTVDEDGQPHAGERPILTSHPDIDGYSVAWSVVHASGGEGFREGRFRTRHQLLDKGWDLEATGTLTLGAYVAGPTNAPAWSPEVFDFTVGPVLDEDGDPVQGATVRVLRDIEVLEAKTDGDGFATFLGVNDTWNDEDVRLIVAKKGYIGIDIPAVIRGYERFVPSGGVLPDLVSEGDDTDLSEGSVYALVGMLAVAVIVLFALVSSHRRQLREVSEDEVDEIFEEDGGGENGGREIGGRENGGREDGGREDGGREDGGRVDGGREGGE